MISNFDDLPCYSGNPINFNIVDLSGIKRWVLIASFENGLILLLGSFELMFNLLPLSNYIDYCRLMQLKMGDLFLDLIQLITVHILVGFKSG